MNTKPLLLSLFVAAGVHAQAIEGRTSIATAPPLAGAPLQQADPTALTLGDARMSSLAWTLLPAVAGLAIMVAADGNPEASGGPDHSGGSNAFTTVGFLILSGGLVVGPSAGHVYLGDGRRAWIGLGLRAGGVGAGALIAYSGGADSLDQAGTFLLLSAAAVVAGGLYSFATLDDAARERRIVLAPTIRPHGTPVLALTARF